MPGRLAALVLLLVGIRGCVAYEYEHEFWLQVDGSGTVFVTGQPRLWAAFKALAKPDADNGALKLAARALFEASGLRVRRVMVTERNGSRYLFVAADFDDVNQLSSTAAFPDLRLRLTPEGERLRLAGSWLPPRPVTEGDAEGLMAVRFHLPGKIYFHQNAYDGVERGNIVAWRQELAGGLSGQPIEFSAVMDRRSILVSTVSLFAVAIVMGLGLLAGVVWWIFRTGRKRTAAMAVSAPPGPGS